MRDGNEMKMRGFLFVLIIASVIAYFVFFTQTTTKDIPKQMEAFDSAKDKLTRSNMAMISRAVELYIAQQGETPQNFKQVRSQQALLGALVDGWGYTIKYERLNELNYRLISVGPDKTFDTEDDIIIDY